MKPIKLKKDKSLRSEIIKLIIFKLLFLFILWQLCFAHPTQKKLDKHKLYQNLTNNTPSHIFSEESKHVT